MPTPTFSGVDTRAKNRQTKTGRNHSHVHKKKWGTGSTKDWSLPPVKYDRGPFSLEIGTYLWRFWGIRGDASDVVLLTEVESASWDDASAVLTGQLTYREPDWAEKLHLREGHLIRCEWSEDFGAHYHPLWTMRLDAPSGDMLTRENSANLVSDLNRLAQSDDDFVFAKGKRKPNGWRSDKAIRFILEKYGYDIASLPVMKSRIKKWHLTNVHPLDVIHSILLRERNMTGTAYGLSMDWRERVHVRPVKRPSSLLVVGPQLLAITRAAQHDPRFATEVTVRGDPVVGQNTDAKGHRKPSYQKQGTTVQTRRGTRLFGLIHRNVYSPDATSLATLNHEGKLFLAAVAKYKKQATVTLPGMPSISRLDAFRLKIPSEGLNHVVYVSDAKHMLGSTGYTVEATLVFQDPFVKDKSLVILNKLTDAASSRSRPLPGPKTSGTKSGKTSKASDVHKSPPPPTFSGVGTNPGTNP